MATETTYTQARIRVSRNGAIVTQAALHKYEAFLLDARDVVETAPEARRLLNMDLRELRRVIEETERTIEEHGWDMDDDKPERSDPA